MEVEVTVYKLVRNYMGKLYSYNFSFALRGTPLCLRYKVGVPTLPKIPDSLLFAWRTKAPATYATDSGFFEVWEAKAIVVPPRNIIVPTPIRIPHGIGARPEMNPFAVSYWKDQNLGVYGSMRLKANLTVLCRSITLTRMVHKNE